jgi:FkbM family methyltransferase
MNRNLSCVKYRGFQYFYNTIKSHSDHAPTRATINGKIWEKKLFEIYRNIIKEDDIVIDVGAYIGTHTLPFAHYAKKVYAFEANENIYNCLNKNIEFNQVENIHCFKVAVSDTNGTDKFSCREDGTSRLKTSEDAIEVATATLDYLLVDISNVKLLKIDAEGAEFKVLSGAKELIKNNKPEILIECWRHKRNTLYDWCKKNNYSYKWLRGDDFHLSPQ